MLDDSGSMNGKPWADLMNEFTGFMNLLSSNNNLL